MRAERLLIRAGIASKLVPVPRFLSANCGVCLRIAWADRETARQVLEDGHVVIDQIHAL